jgi:hypothetical protein
VVDLQNSGLGSKLTQAEREAIVNGAMKDVADILDAGDEKIWRVLVQYENGHSGDWTSPFMSRSEAEVMREAEDRFTSYGWIMDIHGRLEDYGAKDYEHAPKLAPPLSKRLKLGPNLVDVTPDKSGTTGIVGAEAFRNNKK